MRLALVCFYCLCVLFMFSILSRRSPLLATSLSVLFCLLSMLISDSRFDLVWFRLSCDHGWIRSGSVNVRKQQQQQQQLPRSPWASNLSPPAPLPAAPELGVDMVYDHKRGDASVFVYPWRREFPTGESPITHLIILLGEKRVREENMKNSAKTS